MFCTKLQEPCSFSKVPDGSHTKFLNTLRVQKEGTEICMSEWGQGLTLTQNVDWVFLLSAAFPTSGYPKTISFQDSNLNRPSPLPLTSLLIPYLCIALLSGLLDAEVLTAFVNKTHVEPSLCYGFARHRMTAGCRRFGTANPSHLQGSSSPRGLNCMSVEQGIFLLTL